MIGGRLARIWRRWLTAALLAVLAAPLAGSQPSKTIAPPVPLLWKFSRAGSTVYLLGSFHLLRADDYPWSVDIEAALLDAERLVFEISPAQLNDPALASRMLHYARYDDGRTLADVLPQRARRQLAQQLKAQGGSIEQLQGFEPWFVNLSLVTALSQRMGFSSPHGLDQVLMRRGAEQGKPMDGLETLDDQLRTLDQSPLEDQVLSLNEFLQAPGKLPVMLEQLHRAWRNGDAETMDRLSRQEMQDKTPASYRLINVQRNQAWLPKIGALLDEGGDDTLVVVGTLHLLGPDGLVAQLRAQGYEVERICTVCAVTR